MEEPAKLEVKPGPQTRRKNRFWRRRRASATAGEELPDKADGPIDEDATDNAKEQEISQDNQVSNESELYVKARYNHFGYFIIGSCLQTKETEKTDEGYLVRITIEAGCDLAVRDRSGMPSAIYMKQIVTQSDKTRLIPQTNFKKSATFKQLLFI